MIFTLLAALLQVPNRCDKPFSSLEYLHLTFMVIQFLRMQCNLYTLLILLDSFFCIFRNTDILLWSVVVWLISRQLFLSPSSLVINSSFPFSCEAMRPFPYVSIVVYDLWYEITTQLELLFNADIFLWF